MEKVIDVLALGELLIDFTHNGMSAQGNPMFEANPGGAPCNVLAMLRKLSRKTAFIGKVGNDTFGEHLKSIVCEIGIDVEGLVMDNRVPTTLAFVHTKPDGDRSFSFYRNPGADMMLCEKDLPVDKIRQARIFHFGSLSMTNEGVEQATKKAIEIAKTSGAVISFDPNLRPPLWSDLEIAREKIGYGLGVCDVLKISDDEILFMTGEEDIERGVEIIKEKYNIPLICATMGKNGSKAFLNDVVVECPPFLLDNTIETTGAGDTFCACMLNSVLEHGLDMTREQLEEMLRFANAAAALITTKKGALRVMPTYDEIVGLIKKSE